MCKQVNRSEFDDPFGWGLELDRSLPRRPPSDPTGSEPSTAEEDAPLPAERFLPYWGIRARGIAQTPGQRPYNLATGISWIPELPLQWDQEENGPIEAFLTCEETVVAWRCGRGHRYLLPITIFMGDYGCPICNHALLLKSRPKTVANYPKPAQDWDYSLNWPLRPQHVHAHRRSYFNYRCHRCGMGWNTFTSARCRKTRPTGCPSCRSRASRREVELAVALERLIDPEVVHGAAVAGWRGAVDVMISDLKIAIEYDGVRFHDTELGMKNDTMKTRVLRSQGYTVVRVREEPLEAVEGAICLSVQSQCKMHKVVSAVLSCLNEIDSTLPRPHEAEIRHTLEECAGAIDVRLEEIGYYQASRPGKGRRGRHPDAS